MLMIIVSSTLWYVPGNLVHSSFIMDNNNGLFSIDWNGNNAGTASSINMDFDIAQGIAYVTGSTTGSLTTINIQPTSFQSWGSVTITSSGSNPIVTLLDCSSTPIPGFISINYTGPISLSSLSTGSYPCIKVVSELQDTSSSIDDITVTRQPLSQLTLTISGPSTMTAGDCENYYVRWSSNFVNTSGTYLFVTIPHSGGTGLNVPTPGYGQLPASNPVVNYISNSGIRTTLGTMLPDGTIVPPYSIYWIAQGSNNGNTHQYTFRLCTDKGTENNTIMDFNTTISSPNNPSDQTSSLSSTITSAPYVVGDCRDAMGTTGYILLGGSYHFHPYTVKIENIGTEDLFQPEITMDFDAMINYFLTCDNSAFGGTTTGRIQLASGFEWNTGGNQASRSASSINPLSGMLFTPNNGRHPFQLPTSYTFTYGVNYFGCTGGINSLPVPIITSGVNFGPTNLCSLNTSLRGVNTFEGFVFWDINQDGLYDSGTEFVLSGAQVVFQRIHPIYGTTIQVFSTTTNVNGLYSGILPDDTYTIQVYY
ncbi:MAG TPA: hypothetical protein PLW93_05165, partial [Candidatus Absconditabacterales bacterium]|nr:hypothetical protein [Candidatus Absconditabacterales bacterium]